MLEGELGRKRQSHICRRHDQRGPPADGIFVCWVAITGMLTGSAPAGRLAAWLGKQKN